MRNLLASSLGVTCAAALALPMTLPATEAAAIPAKAVSGTPPARADGTGIPGSTQSLPLAPITDERDLGSAAAGLSPRSVRPFSLVGVIWDDPTVELNGRVQVRTRSVGTGTWSDWQDLETHNTDHAPDADTDERTSGRVRGATAPLWVGDSDGVEVLVRAVEPTRAGAAPLPAGLRLELVDPGAETAVEPPARHTPDDPPLTELLSPEVAEASAPNSELAPLGAALIPALDQAQSQKELLTLQATVLTDEQKLKPYIGPRPAIVTRRGWGADETLREKEFSYTKSVKAAFVHHTATGNNYTCAQAPSVIRGIYRYHVKSMGWRDIGYNFLVDKCGNIYEGRAGGVAKPVMGAHTLGFNSDSMGIAAIGTFNSAGPTSTTVTAVSQLSAWKLGLFAGNPGGKTYLKSAGGNLYAKGKNVRLNVISGHRDGFSTDCPGALLYGKLGSIRTQAARFQGRP
ncbi:peptidoglycan recognition protein family protein [Streptomyces cadmiisoli]|uniref:peptidoglycan recognition protein family protein n=1 Tax=Streptomyces cadmiisoli TaxID=2184053 RepID=UPI003665ADF6